MRKITLSNTIYPGSKLDVDKDGFVYLIVGAIGTYSTNGAYYPITDLTLSHFKPESNLSRRLRSGVVTGEADHPRLRPGEDMVSFVNRHYYVDKDREAALFKSIELLQTNFKETGRDDFVTLIGARLKPYGKMADKLKANIDDPTADTAFSIRVFTKDYVRNNTVFKEYLNIINWDWVTNNRPGLQYAHKSVTLRMQNITTEADSPILTTESMNTFNPMEEMVLSIDLDNKDMVDTFMSTSSSLTTESMEDNVTKQEVDTLKDIIERELSNTCSNGKCNLYSW